MLSYFSNFIGFLGTTQWNRYALGIILCAAAIGLGAGFGVLSTNAKISSQEDYERRVEIFTDWQMTVTTTFTRASTLAASAATFAKSAITTPANLSATAAERIQLLNPTAFNEIFAELYAEVPGISAVQLQSGGVISQVWPPGSSLSLFGFDVMNSPAYNTLYEKLIDEGKPITSAQSMGSASMDSYGISVRYPIFVGAVKNRSTFWGVGSVLILVHVWINEIDLERGLAQQNMDYALWFEVNGSRTIVSQTGVSVYRNATNYSAAPNVERVMNDGLRMKIPISEAGKAAFLAIYPRNGPVSENMSASDIISVVLGTILGSLGLVMVLYVVLFANFYRQHRHAPSQGEHSFAAIITLRGAQAAVERAPNDANRIFAEFIRNVREKATSHGCYIVCQVGDRSLYVVSRRAASILALSQQIVANVVISCTLEGDEFSNNKSFTVQSNVSATVYGKSRSRCSEDMVTSNKSVSKLMNTILCRPSAVLVVQPDGCPRGYDSERNVYFYSSAPQLSKLGGLADHVKIGEIAWSDSFGRICEGDLCAREQLETVKSSALALTMVSTANAQQASTPKKIQLNVATFVGNGETDDAKSQNADDPSMAMVFLTDPFVLAMSERLHLHIAHQEVKIARQRSKKQRKDSETQSASQSQVMNAKVQDSAYVYRSSTILKILLIDDPRSALDTIRHIAMEERGIIVSAAGQTVIVTFNLMSPSGHHQLRAADTVDRLRESLECSFVCAICDGKVGALVSDNIVMCTGDVMTVCDDLLSKAQALSKSSESRPTNIGVEDPAAKALNEYGNSVLPFDDDGDINVLDLQTRMLTSYTDGMCLLLCQNELTSAFDCEAVDLFTTGKRKIIYRLCGRKSHVRQVKYESNPAQREDEEWMYCLKDDDTDYGATNAIFIKIRLGEIEEARRMWKQLSANKSVLVSDIAKASLRKLLNE